MRLAWKHSQRRMARFMALMLFLGTGLGVALVGCGSIHLPGRSSHLSGEADRPMTLARLEQVLRGGLREVEGGNGVWKIRLDGVPITCLTAASVDRMRLVAPIKLVKDMSPEETARVLEANYSSAVDARYATSQGVLYAAYTHPLSALTAAELTSAIHQVARLVQTYGKGYASGGVRRGPSAQEN